MRTFILIAVLIVDGCATTVSEQELRQRYQANQGNSFPHLYYKGRHKGYDYFTFYLGDTMRIKVPNAVIDEPMAYTGRNEDWRIILFER